MAESNGTVRMLGVGASWVMVAGVLVGATWFLAASVERGEGKQATLAEQISSTNTRITALSSQLEVARERRRELKDDVETNEKRIQALQSELQRLKYEHGVPGGDRR